MEFVQFRGEYWRCRRKCRWGMRWSWWRYWGVRGVSADGEGGASGGGGGAGGTFVARGSNMSLILAGGGVGLIKL